MNQNNSIFTKIKSTLESKNIISVAAMSALTLSIYTIYNRENQANFNRPSIDINGTCLRKISKDRYKTEITVKITDTKSSANALTKGKDIYKDLIDFADKLQTEDKSIEMNSSQIQVSEEKSWSSKNEKYIDNGFSATLSLEISTEKPETLDKIIAFVSTKKNILIGGIDNYISPQKMKFETEECLAEAITNAKEKATVMAKASGNRIGNLLSAYVANYNHTPMPRRAGIAMTASPMMLNADNTAIESSMIKSSDEDLTVQVNAKFEIR